MPRKSASSAVQRGGTTDNENVSRRSTRSSSRHDSSGSVTSRTRRSSTTAQTAVSLAESRVTRSRNVSNRNRSSSPPETTRTRQTREISLESPASRVKTTRRSTGRINYQESEGEEDMTSATEKNEEEEYHVEDDIEESDSEESNKSRTRSRTTTRSPPKVRGRGRGRPPKAVKGKSSRYADDNFDDDDDDEDEDEEEEEESDEKVEESDTIDEIIPTRRNKAQNESESTQKARGTKRRMQSDSLPMRSTRSGKTVKETTETDKTHFSPSTRQTRLRKMSSEATNVPVEDVDKKENSKSDDKIEEIESTDEKRKRKLDVKKEPKKRFKSEDTNLGNEKDENQEKCEKSESLQENAKLLHSDIKLGDDNPEETSSETCKSQINNLISSDKMDSDEMIKVNNTENTKSEISDLSASKGNSSIDSVEKMCEDDSQNNELMEVDDDTPLTIEEKTNSECLSVGENKESENDTIKEKTTDSEDKDYCTTKLITEKENNSVIRDLDNSKNNVLNASTERKSDSQASSKVSTECTNLVGTDTENTKSKQAENEKSEKNLSVIAASSTKPDKLPLEKVDSQDSSKPIEESSSISERSVKDTENNATSNQKEMNSSCSSLQSNKISFSEKNATSLSLTEVLPVNGANISTEKSRNNESGDILDMSKTSDNSASETEKIAVESLTQAPSNTECLIKPNGAPNNLMQSGDTNCIDLPNRKYVYNSSLSEDSKACLQDKTFSLISYNLSAIPNESSSQNEKLLTELKRTNSDFICLQEIPKKCYDILESDLNSLGYKGLISIPENKIRGLGTFYRASSFNLKRQAGVSLQKIIDQDLETSSLENADKIAIRTFLQKCGYVLMIQFCTVNDDYTLTIANVFFPPSDISTHALQMSSLVREVVNFAADIARPHILCGSFNMKEGGVAYQLLREGYMNNEMIEELQKRKDVALPGKDNDTLVNLLWKAFQHPSSNLRSCYATVLGHELHLDGENSITSPDLLWYSSDSFETIGVLDVVPVDKNNIDPVALKADIAYIC